MINFLINPLFQSVFFALSSVWFIFISYRNLYFVSFPENEKTQGSNLLLRWKHIDGHTRIFFVLGHFLLLTAVLALLTYIGVLPIK
ncbi:hypothetical protein BM477_01100 [Boudabousia marimammalium]|uniref:Uncharacterized protein n=1 Tax=Boudabousia marimammalium TaxID=156892 RepID=A0A1Q5PSN0_9ACTO|nr:hypothetical protein BM477_01100 [Boudabousia marimammalium]